MKNLMISRIIGWCLIITAIASLEGCEKNKDAAGNMLHYLPGTQTFPESVAINQENGSFYVGSVKEGTIFIGHIGKDDATVFSPAGADGRNTATGMFYSKGKLIVAGRQTGMIYVYNTLNKQLIAKLSVGLSGLDQTFLNDVAIAPDGIAYITDSVNPELYSVQDSSGVYVLRRFIRFDNNSLIKYIKANGAAGINLNGIAITSDGKYMIVAKRNENALFRIHLQTKTINRINIDGGIDTPDGLFLTGSTLYVAQNIPKSVAVLSFAADYASAKVTRNIIDTSFAFPTAVQRYQNRLLVVSSQFNTLGSPAAVSGDTPPRTPFWLTELSEHL